VHHKLEKPLDQYLKATGLEKEAGISPFSSRRAKDREAIAAPACAHGRRGHAQATTQTSKVASSLFASLLQGDRYHKFSKTTAVWKPLSESLATPTAGRQNSMTAAARRGQKVLLEDMERMRY
jgi:hypothetical protein